MKIQPVQKAIEVRKVQAAQTGVTPNSEHKADVVRLSGASKELTAAAMQEAPDTVDLAALKEAIRSGDYQPDMSRLADRLLTDADTISTLLND